MAITSISYNITLKKKNNNTVLTKTASNASKVQKSAIYQDKTQHANFRGDPELQIVSYKSTLKQQLNGKKQTNKKHEK